MFAILYLGATLHCALAAKVLVIPGNIRSHILYMGQLGQALSQQGHGVTLLLPSNAHTSLSFRNSTMEIVTYVTQAKTSYADSKAFSELFANMALAKSKWEKIMLVRNGSKEMKEAIRDECDGRFESDTYGMIKARGYDLALIDPDTECGFAYPYTLDIPYAPVCLPVLGPALYRLPALPSFTPSFVTTYSDSMTFTERLLNTVAEFVIMGTFYDSSTEYVERYAPHKPILKPHELVLKSVLWFSLAESTFHYPSPSMPNIVRIGDIMAKPANPLPNELNDFLDNADDGVILVSLGSFFNFVPLEIVQKFCIAFSNVKAKVVWKIKDVGNCDFDEDKIKVMSWVPQNDVLAHPYVKLFLTHGGFNSIIESIHNAKVMLVMPLAGDQPSNANIVRNRNLGISMDIGNFQISELIDNINTLFTDVKYKRHIQVVSNVLHDKLHSAGERASFAINHVTKFGGGHLRSGAFEMYLFQFLMLDVYLCISVCFVIFVSILLIICFYFIQLIRYQIRYQRKDINK